MKRLQSLMDEVSNWSDATFDNGNCSRRRSVAVSHHLQKEAVELTEALQNYFSDETYETGTKVEDEFSDVLMLLLDAASHYGLNAKELVNNCQAKLEINTERQWGMPDENGVVEHIRK